MKKALIFTVLALGLTFAGYGTASTQQTSAAGDWDAVYNTPGGPRPLKLTLTVDGEKLGGTAKRPTGDVPVTGTIKGEDITFAYTINYGGNDLTLTFRGKFKGDTMGGTVIIGSTEDEWSAKRAPAKAN